MGEGAKKKKTATRGFSQDQKISTGYTSMEEIVARAYAEAKPGSVVLLSPAAASFGLFKNYKDRGNQFKAYAQTLTPKTHSA